MSAADALLVGRDQTDDRGTPSSASAKDDLTTAFPVDALRRDVEARTFADALAVLRFSPDHRILTRLRIPAGPTGEGDPSGTSVGVAVDVETTGLDPVRDDVIELALRRFRFDAAGVVTDIGRPYAWLQDPGRPLDPEVVRMTGLTDAVLAGRAIPVDLATSIIARADLVCGHNAAFDRGHVEHVLPGAAGLPWACSCRDIAWPARGMEGRALGWLLWQCGWFHGAHRAGDDVDALIALLRHRFDDGSTALAEMVARAEMTGWVVRAVGAHIDRKDVLKRRGYAWDPDRRVWFREVAGPDRLGEQLWLDREIYGPGGRARAPGATFEEVTWLTRYARPPRPPVWTAAGGP